MPWKSSAWIRAGLNRANCANVISSKILKYPCIISERVHTTSHFGTGVSASINKIIVRLSERGD
jgi:N-acetylgalactosamine-N,N'-diacetylbacillosaminyl-diphospho-undecaprenol 4-alpha-N-acetylgalactosaminyltransferase